MTDPVDGYVEGLGHRLRLQVSGTGRPLLLLNGLGGSLDSWSPLIAALTGRTSIAFDPPGVGSSPAPGYPLSVAAVARIACSVLDAVGVPTADVLGFSYGGVIAQELAASAPERVRRLILVSTACGLGATASELRPLSSGLSRPILGQGADPQAMRGLWWQLPGIATWSAIPLLARIKARTLVVYGASDRVLPPVNSRVLARRIPDATLANVPGGHDLTRAEHASALAALITRFLDGLARDERRDTAPTLT